VALRDPKPYGVDCFFIFLWVKYADTERWGVNMSEIENPVVPFAPTNKGNGGDQLDKAGQSILNLLHKAAGVAEKNNQHALDVAQKLSHQLVAAEQRVTDLEAEVERHRDMAERAEQWLHKVYSELPPARNNGAVTRHHFAASAFRKRRIPASRLGLADKADLIGTGRSRPRASSPVLGRASGWTVVVIASRVQLYRPGTTAIAAYLRWQTLGK
jgi:hypothetical protein